MVILYLLQRLFGLASLAALAAGGWLVWSWIDHRDSILATEWQRDDRWLYAGLALLALSVLGRPVVLFLAARRGPPDARLDRAAPVLVTGPDGAVLRTERYGRRDGPTLVFTHGWGMDSTIWREAKDQLSDRFRLVFWDLPGLGRSSQPRDGRYAVERLAEDLRAIVADCGGPVVLVGHSIGGMIVQTLCARHPEMLGRQVAGIVLENTTHTNPLNTLILAPLWRALRRPVIEPMMRLDIRLQPVVWLMAWHGYLSGSTQLAMRLAGFGSRPTRAQLDHASLLVTRNPPGVQAKGNLAMFRWGVTEALPAIDVPTLVLIGGRDIVTLPSAGELIAGALPAARAARIARAGHMGPVECGRDYNDALAAFALQALAPSAAPRTERAAVG